jgi:hypothetical protein
LKVGWLCRSRGVAVALLGKRTFLVKLGSLVRYFEYPGNPLNGKLALIVEVVGKKRSSSFTASKFYFKIYIDGKILLTDRESLWTLQL